MRIEKFRAKIVLLTRTKNRYSHPILDYVISSLYYIVNKSGDRL